MNCKYISAAFGAALVLALGAANIGSAQEKQTDFPVVVLQKTGNDAERNVWLFVGDGYTSEEQDKFLADTRERVAKILTIEPYKSYRDGINIYAMKAVSKESGTSRAADKGKDNAQLKDTYLGVHHNSCGVERLGWFFPEGEKRLQHLIRQMERSYLDKGGRIMQTSVLANSDFYFGGGALSYAIASLAAGEAMVVHEASHGFANLADEYNGNPQEGPNKTKQTDLRRVPWREFFGFRNVELYKYGNGAQKPVKGGCLMNSLYVQNGYCEVCREHVAAILNKGMKAAGKRFYMAEPSLTLYEDDNMKTGAMLTADNINEANSKKVQLRTIVRNYTDKDEQFVLRLTLRDKQLRVKYQQERSFTVTAGRLQSLELVTDTMSGLGQGDRASWIICEGTDRRIVSKG